MLLCWSLKAEQILQPMQKGGLVGKANIADENFVKAFKQGLFAYEPNWNTKKESIKFEELVN